MNERSPEDEGTPLAGDELLARVIVSRRHIVISTGSVRWEAFDPSPGDKLSVLRHAAWAAADISPRCQLVATLRKKNLVGRADITAEAVAGSGHDLVAVAAARSHDPWHAHVQGYPAEESLRMSVMQALASSASFVPMDNPVAGPTQ